MIEKKKILITGCSGFLSSYLIGELIDRNNIIYGITEVKGFKSSDFNVINVDIRDNKEIDKIIGDIKPDQIYHLAAISNVGFSWKNPSLTYEVNFIGSSNLLESVRKYSSDTKILLMSSAEVYKVEEGKRITENSSIEIKNPYALSKYAMEMTGQLYKKAYGMNVLIVRSFNFTGPGQDRAFVISDFSYQIASIEKNLSSPVIKVGNLSARRDFSDVRDIAKYLHIIMEQGDKGQIYNLCSGNAYSINELLDLLLKISEKRIKIEVDKDKLRVSDAPVLSCDNSLLRSKFDLRPKYSIAMTLEDSLEFWRKKLS